MCRLCRSEYKQKTAGRGCSGWLRLSAEKKRKRRNLEENLCGWYECPNEMYARCERCGLSYCPRHVSRYRYSYRYRTRKGVYQRQAEVTLCDACKHYIARV